MLLMYIRHTVARSSLISCYAGLKPGYDRESGVVIGIIIKTRCRRTEKVRYFEAIQVMTAKAEPRLRRIVDADRTHGVCLTF